MKSFESTDLDLRFDADPKPFGQEKLKRAKATVKAKAKAKAWFWMKEPVQASMAEATSGLS